MKKGNIIDRKLKYNGEFVTLRGLPLFFFNGGGNENVGLTSASESTTVLCNCFKPICNFTI
jgi:hypothetical protein